MQENKILKAEGWKMPRIWAASQPEVVWPVSRLTGLVPAFILTWCFTPPVPAAVVVACVRRRVGRERL